jgi:P-type Cu2+ transporter
MMYAVPVYLADGMMTADIEQLMRIASLLLTAPVVVWSALPFYRGALRDLLNRRVGMDVPISAGILIAFGASAAVTLRGSGDVYFDSVTMFVFLLLAARFVDLSARGRAAEAQERLARLAPAVAERFDAFPGSAPARTVPAALLAAGDCVLIRPGARIPADGVVVDGVSAADESLLTGESRPVPKQAGDALTGGAVNLHSPLVMRVERVGEDTVLAGIVRLMDRAQGEKPAIAAVADRAARWFVAAQLVLTVTVAAGWYAIDPSRALWIAVALLVVTCPCALSLATPTALTAATGVLYGEGLLIGRGHALETLAAATHVVFDKTGTLTDGRMALVGVIAVGGASREDALAIAAALEAGSEHPISRAIMAAASTPVAGVTQVRSEPGQGMEGTRAGRTLRIGRPGFVAALHGQPLPREWMYVSDDVTAVALGDDRGWIALLTFRDALRQDARRVVHELGALGKTVGLLSGDHAARVEGIARDLGIALYRGDATPESKLEFVRGLQSQGAVVVMIGDGVNDAPVLAQAQTSIALARGTDLAQSSADMVLMGERLQPVLTAVKLAQRTLAVVRQNLAWAVAYNAVAVPLAALGFVTPLWAAVGMSVSSLVVVLNALRLQRLPARAHQESAARLAPAAT